MPVATAQLMLQWGRLLGATYLDYEEQGSCEGQGHRCHTAHNQAGNGPLGESQSWNGWGTSEGVGSGCTCVACRPQRNVRVLNGSSSGDQFMRLASCRQSQKHCKSCMSYQHPQVVHGCLLSSRSSSPAASVDRQQTGVPVLR